MAEAIGSLPNIGIPFSATQVNGESPPSLITPPVSPFAGINITQGPAIASNDNSLSSTVKAAQDGVFQNILNKQSDNNFDVDAPVNGSLFNFLQNGDTSQLTRKTFQQALAIKEGDAAAASTLPSSNFLTALQLDNTAKQSKTDVPTLLFQAKTEEIVNNPETAQRFQVEKQILGKQFTSSQLKQIALSNDVDEVTTHAAAAAVAKKQQAAAKNAAVVQSAIKPDSQEEQRAEKAHQENLEAIKKTEGGLPSGDEGKDDNPFSTGGI